MKNTKKLFALLLVVVMMLALGTTALAADTNVELTVPSDSRAYAIYQIFTGDLATEDGKDILSNVKWGADAKLPTGANVGDAVPAETLKAIAAITGTSDADILAELDDYYDLTGEAFATVTKDATDRVVSVPTGYYLIKDLGPAPAGSEISQYVVQVVGPTTITPKTGTTTTEKKVDDKNDSTGAEDEIVWQDSADHDIGDAVSFQLTATITEKYAEYDHYYFAFHDKQSSGLTFNADSVKVFVGTTEIKNTQDKTYYTVKTSGLSNNETFVIEFMDLKAIDAVAAGSVITATYTSTLNDGAVIGAAGNPNTMYGEFSNNPNNTGDGTRKPNDTTTTPEDKVIVFTYELDGTKYANEAAEGNELKGAGFTLYKWVNSADKDGKDTSDWVAIGSEIKSDEDGALSWAGLDDGKYKLEETDTPLGFNTMADIVFTVAAEHDVEADDPALTKLTVTPSDSFTVVMTSEDDDATPTGKISTDLVNMKGATLPETGGIGTTIFYVLGGILLVGAAVLLITKKRMGAED